MFLDFLKTINGEMIMRYINQLEYRHIPYRTNVLNPEYTEEM